MKLPSLVKVGSTSWPDEVPTHRNRRVRFGSSDSIAATWTKATPAGLLVWSLVVALFRLRPTDESLSALAAILSPHSSCPLAKRRFQEVEGGFAPRSKHRRIFTSQVTRLGHPREAAH